MFSKHGRKIRQVAQSYRDEGYFVRADIPGYRKPLNVGSHRADIVAMKGRNKVLVEVETPISMVTDFRQRQAIRKIADNRGYRFRTVRTK